MMTPGTFILYAIRCVDGEIERHAVSRPSRLDLVLRQAARKDETSPRCGPHALVEATVTMSEWRPLADHSGDIEVVKKSVAQLKADAEQHPCPKCGVMTGQACENLTARRAGFVVPTSWPHAERDPRFRTAP